LEANPYEPFVLISAGSFKLVRDTDVEYGLELCDLANKYNEKPQGWYNWPLIIYYSRIGNYKRTDFSRRCERFWSWSDSCGSCA